MTKNEIFTLDSQNINRILVPLSKTQFPLMQLCEESVEAHEKAQGKATNVLPLDKVIHALQTYVNSLLELKEALNNEVERDTASIIARYVALTNKRSLYPDLIPEYNIQEETEQQKQVEARAIENIDIRIGWCVEKAQGLLDRAEKI